MAIRIVDAARQSKRNVATHRALVRRHEALAARCEEERQAQDAARRLVYDEALVPFETSFSRLKNVDLAELARIALPGGTELPDLELLAVRLSISGLAGAMAGGLGSGAGAGAAAYATVGAFATASTGAPIAGLSGAAATNATLAFLGGGSLASGGGGIAAGTMVLGGVVAVPVVAAGAAYVTWQGRKQYRVQREVASTLAGADAEFGVTVARTEAVLLRSERVRGLLAELFHAIVARLPRLACLVAVNDDCATYSRAQRAEVASLVGLVSATVALMAAPLVDAEGAVTDLSDTPLATARDLLGDRREGGDDAGSGVAA